MYLPAHFREDRPEVLHDAIRNTRLATLVTLGSDGLEATPLPLLLEGDVLLGHLARANPQWRRFDPKVPALAIFTGPEAYVTPSWYATKKATGKAVPTWNYLAVHATVDVEVVEDPADLLRLVTLLTDRHEAGREDRWRVTDAPADFIEGMLKGIVGLRLPIRTLEGKWKMSQNRPPEDRAGVVDGLRQGGAAEQAVAAVMAGLSG